MAERESLRNKDGFCHTGDKGGKYTIDELREKVEEYFEKCKPRVVTDENGNPIYENPHRVAWTNNCPTINGLCRFLGYFGPVYMNRLLKHNSPRAAIMRDAILRIAEWHESRLGDRNNAGSIFWLSHAQRDVWGDDREVRVKEPDTLNYEETLRLANQVKLLVEDKLIGDKKNDDTAGLTTETDFIECPM